MNVFFFGFADYTGSAWKAITTFAGLSVGWDWFRRLSQMAWKAVTMGNKGSHKLVFYTVYRLGWVRFRTLCCLLFTKRPCLFHCEVKNPFSWHPGSNVHRQKGTAFTPTVEEFTNPSDLFCLLLLSPLDFASRNRTQNIFQRQHPNCATPWWATDRFAKDLTLNREHLLHSRIVVFGTRLMYAWEFSSMERRHQVWVFSFVEHVEPPVCWIWQLCPPC